MPKRLALGLKSGTAYVEFGFNKPEPPPLALLPCPEPVPAQQVTNPKSWVLPCPQGDGILLEIYIQLLKYSATNKCGMCMSGVQDSLLPQYRRSYTILRAHLKKLIEQGFVRTEGSHSWTHYWPVVPGK